MNITFSVACLTIALAFNLVNAYTLPFKTDEQAVEARVYKAKIFCRRLEERRHDQNCSNGVCTVCKSILDK